MEQMRRFAWVLALVLLVSILPAMNVSAAQADAIWINPIASDDRVEVNVCANTTATNGLITLNYDSDAMRFLDVTVNSSYVAAYAVNAEEAGTVKIAWVAPGDYDLDGTVHIPLQVNFQGESGDSAVLSGTVYTSEEVKAVILELNFTQLDDAVEEALELDADNVTQESYQAVAEALAEAEAVRKNPLATQEDLDAAAKKLSDAIEALVLAPTEEPTEEPTNVPAEVPTDAPTEEPTQGTADTEGATEATDAEADDPTAGDSGTVTPGTGDQTPIGLIIAVMAICAVGILAVAIIIKRKENDK